jgi:long-chain acyl-CoA synthetase
VANPREEIALIQYTGGTTGLPKGVLLTHANFSANVAQALAVLHMLNKNEDVFAGVLPIFHVYGFCLCILVTAALADTLVLVPRYEPGELLKLIEKYRIGIFPGAPSIYLSLMQHKDLKKYNLSSMRYAISGSAPISAEALVRFKELTGCSIVEGYGLTECSPITHLNPADGSHRFGSIGLPLPGTEARIVDMEVGSIELPPGKPGELAIRGPQVMRGYAKQPDETAGSLRNGWLYTGDIAYMDEDGFFYIMDRKKDMVIVGGYNVYPREIDDVLLEHPGIREAVAVAVLHPTRGETLKAYVVLQEGVTMTAADVVAYCRKKLANYKVPRRVEFRDNLPRAMTGKVLRRALRQEELERYQKNSQEAI